MNDKNIRMYANLTNAFTSDKMKYLKNHLKYSGKAPFETTVNKTDNEKVGFKLIDYVSSPSGYQGYLYENKSTGELVVVHEGSMDLSNTLTEGSEVYKDWAKADGKHFFGKLSEQFYDSNNFLNKVKSEHPNAKIVQAGQSLGGTLAEMNGALKVNKNIPTYTYNALGADRSGKELEKKGYKLSDDYSNIHNYTYDNEMVSKMCHHFGDVYSANIEETKGNKIHRLETHQEANLEYKLRPQKPGFVEKLKSSIPKGGTTTGGAAPVESEGSKSSSGSSKSDGDGHWITTKKGQHVFIEDELPRERPRQFVYDLIEIDETGRGTYLSRPRTYEELLENSRKGNLMKNVDENKYWNYETNPVSKVGVFDYLGCQISRDLIPDKVYRVYRPAEEIASPEALRTLRLLPIVDDHQMLGSGSGLMPAEEKGVHGVLGENAYIENGYLYSDMRIFSEHLKDQINSGKKELSLGYRCEYDYTPGVYQGIAYDMKQTNIRYNHLALVQSGRMGSDVCVMDSKISFDAHGYCAPQVVVEDWPEVYFSPDGHSQEYWEIQNDPALKAYLSGKKGD